MKEAAWARALEFWEVVGGPGAFPDSPLECLPVEDRLCAAQCLERLNEGWRASIHYEACGALKDALRCLRSVPEPGQALHLARRLQSPDEAALAWMVSFSDSLFDSNGGVRALTLTEAEKGLLKVTLQRAGVLPGRRSR